MSAPIYNPTINNYPTIKEFVADAVAQALEAQPNNGGVVEIVLDFLIDNGKVVPGSNHKMVVTIKALLP